MIHSNDNRCNFRLKTLLKRECLHLFWHSGFQGLYDVDIFIRALRYDVRIVESIPEIRKNGKTKKIKAFQVCFHIQYSYSNAFYPFSLK